MKLTTLAEEWRIPGTEGIDLIASWLINPDTDAVIGMTTHHPHNEITNGDWAHCGGARIVWTETQDVPSTGHLLARGGPRNLDDLTVTPSVQHHTKGDTRQPSPHHGCHGFLTDGRWVVS